MKREARLLLGKGLDSVVLGIEHFNRPTDRGRITSVLIFLDHAFEMILKAAILHRGGRIREPKKRETIGFDSCIRKGVSDGTIRFLADEQAITLQAINGLRDAAQHHLIDISEHQLYMHAQSGVTLFRDLLKSVFGKNLSDSLPPRVLPVSTIAPNDLETLFDSEITEVAKLLKPGKRRQTEAFARLRPLAILDATIRGEKLQPGDTELRKIANNISSGKPWTEIFSGAAAVSFSTEGAGPTLSIRLTKKEGIPVQLVPEGTPGASVVAIKRVDELGFYGLSRDQIADKIKLSGPKTSALIWLLKLAEDPDCFKEFVIGKSKFKRYSQKAIERLTEAMKSLDLEKVWHSYNSRAKNSTS